MSGCFTFWKSFRQLTDNLALLRVHVSQWLDYYLIVCKHIRTASNTCSTTIPAKSRKISFRSEIDCTICRISLSRSSTITVFCSTSISWSSVNPWNKRIKADDFTVIRLLLQLEQHMWPQSQQTLLRPIFRFMTKLKRTRITALQLYASVHQWSCRLHPCVTRLINYT